MAKNKKGSDLKWKEGEKKKNRYRLMAGIGEGLEEAAQNLTDTVDSEKAKTMALKDKMKRKTTKPYRKQSSVGED